MDRETRERRRTPGAQERKRAILDAAERLLAERPLQRVPVAELARGAGLSRPTFYFYFSSKEEVLLALADRVVGEMRRRTDPALARLAEDPERGWEEVIRGVFETWREHRTLMNAACEALSTSPEVRRVWERTLEGFVDLTTRAIEDERERGAASGGTGVPARDLATALNWANERMLYATFSGTSPAVPEDRLVGVLVEMWLAAIYGRR